MNTEIAGESDVIPEKSSKKGFLNFIKNNKTLTIVFFALVLVAAVWFWKNQEVSAIKAASEKQFSENQNEALKLFAKPYVWAIRKELLTKNFQEINLYASDMIHENNFQTIMVSDVNGIVISSTEKKAEGQDIRTLMKPEYLDIESTTVNMINDSLVILNSPIMGFNAKLGMLTIYKKVEKLKF